MNIDQYRYLWDGSEPGWVLVRDPESLAGSGPAFDIFNQTTHMMLIVEDDELARALVARMHGEGVDVLDSIPPGGPYG